MRRLALAATLGIALALTGLSARPAWAHPLLLQASPAPDAVLPASPARILLLFSENVNPLASRISVQNSRHQTVTVGRTVLAPGNAEELEIGLRHLPGGSYLVFWQAVSAEDGHIVNGAYLFSVQRRDPAVLLPPTPGGTGQGLPSLDVLVGILVHWLALMAVVTWVGSAVVTALAVRAAGRSVNGAALGAASDRLVATIRISGAMAVVANGADLLTKTYALGGTDWSSALAGSALRAFFADQYGLLWIVRQALLLMAMATTVGIPTGRSVPRWLSRTVVEGGSWHLVPGVPVALGALYLYALAASGHAASSSVGAVAGSHIISGAVLVDWLHLLGVALWLGGQVGIVLVLMPALKIPGDGRNTRPFLAVLDRFSPVAYGSIAILALSGVFNSTIHIPSWFALLHSMYGTALITKLALTGLMVLVSAYTVYGLRPRLYGALDAPVSAMGTTSRAVLGRLALWLRINPILGAGVLLEVSVMFFYPVPASLSASSVPQWRQAGLQGTLVHFLALSTRDPELAFAAAYGGVYRRNGDQGWKRVLKSGDLWSVQLLPDDRTVIAADNNGDVDVSHDRGAHWQQTRVATGGVFAVSAVPGSAKRFLAGGAGGIYASSDGGLHWRRPLLLRESAGAAIVWQPGSKSVVFAGAVAGGPRGDTRVFISRDAGYTWHVFGHNLGSQGGIMSLLATRRAQVFAGTMGAAVWSASGQNSTWFRRSSGMPLVNDHVAALVAILGRPGLLYAGTLGFGLFRTIDGGLHWTSASAGLPSSRNATIVLSLAYDPVENMLYAGTADGVYALGRI